MTTDTLFNIEPTKPTKLQAARRALADAERELAAAIERDLPENELGNSEIDDYQRAVNRFAELVKAEELSEMNNSKQQP
jgi:hypothetical protein